MGVIASQITSLTIVYSIVYSVQTHINESIKATRHWPLCGWWGGGEIFAQMASYAENVSIWWRTLKRKCHVCFTDISLDISLFDGKPVLSYGVNCSFVIMGNHVTLFAMVCAFALVSLHCPDLYVSIYMRHLNIGSPVNVDWDIKRSSLVQVTQMPCSLPEAMHDL